MMMTRKQAGKQAQAQAMVVEEAAAAALALQQSSDCVQWKRSQSVSVVESEEKRTEEVSQPTDPRRVHRSAGDMRLKQQTVHWHWHW